MTRKQALLQAVRLLEELPPRPETDQVLDALRQLADSLPLTSWDEASIFDAIDQFFLDHGRFPNAKELDSRGLPSHTVISRRFGMTAVEFLDAFYPDRRRPISRALRAYRQHSAQHWLTVFRQQMALHSVRTASQYNRMRTQGPGWAYIARRLGLSTWNQLVAQAGLTLPKPAASNPKPEFFVSRSRGSADPQALRQIRDRLPPPSQNR